MDLFDTHAHYDDEAFDPDREALLGAMPENGIERIVNPGCDLLSSRKALKLAERFPHVYAAVGWHPENCAAFTPGEIDTLRALARHPKVVAIGEIGLDYHWAENPPKEHQQEVLRRQFVLARELGLPVIFHDRDAHADALAIAREFPTVRGVFHCFSGSVEMVRELWRLGWYVGFDGPLTYKNARKTIEVAREAPVDRILLETDSPYLPPAALRGTRNDSRNLRHVAEKLAEIRGATVEEIAMQTKENGKRLFHLY